MNARRALADTLIDLVDRVTLYPGPGLRATSMELTLPVEVSMELGGLEPVFRADLPLFVYRTQFDLTPSRLTVLWHEGETT